MLWELICGVLRGSGGEFGMGYAGRGKGVCMSFYERGYEKL